MATMNKLSKMADAALARREARRKRILENSHNRLQLISNITADECCKEAPVISVTKPIPEQNDDIPGTKIEHTPAKEVVNNGVTVSEPVSFGVLSDDNLEDDLFGEQVRTNDSAAFVFPKSEPSESPFFEKLTIYKYDLVLISLLIQLLYSFSIIPFDNTYFFLPLAIYTTTKIIFFPKQENNKYANILMLLNGLTSQRSHQTLKIMSVLHWVSIAVQDACIYLFTTICVQSVFVTLNSFIS